MGLGGGGGGGGGGGEVGWREGLGRLGVPTRRAVAQPSSKCESHALRYMFTSHKRRHSSQNELHFFPNFSSSILVPMAFEVRKAPPPKTTNLSGLPTKPYSTASGRLKDGEHKNSASPLPDFADFAHHPLLAAFEN